MTTPAEAAADLYGQLKPQADTARARYILERTPAELQTLMQGLIGGDVTISNGTAVAVVSLAGAPVPGSPGTAEVAGGVITDIKLTV